MLLFVSVVNSAAGSRQDQVSFLGIGARAMAMNGAYTAVSNDYAAPFWNPGAMDFFSTTKIGAMVTNMSLNRHLRFVSAAFPTNRWGAFAVAWTGFAVDDIEARNSNTPQPDRLFDYHENTFFLSYAYRILPFLSLGATAKFLHFQVLESTANGFGGDLGLLFALGKKARFGLAAKNLVSNLKWSTGTQEKYVPNYRLGIAIDPLSNFLVTADYYQVRNSKGEISLATEFIALNVFKIRCGIGRDRFSAGLGLTFQSKGLFLNINYAIATDQFGLGTSDGFDLSLVF
ncbi:MAG: hypothetical protein ONB32_09250 [candidate division KSB1 bacterium]|nr:hypothetical protein [candidate division KSB1 bacterium]